VNAEEHALLWPPCCLSCACSGVVDVGPDEFMCPQCGAVMVALAGGGFALLADTDEAGA